VCLVLCPQDRGGQEGLDPGEPIFTILFFNQEKQSFHLSEDKMSGFTSASFIQSRFPAENRNEWLKKSKCPDQQGFSRIFHV